MKFRSLTFSKTVNSILNEIYHMSPWVNSDMISSKYSQLIGYLYIKDDDTPYVVQHNGEVVYLDFDEINDSVDPYSFEDKQVILSGVWIHSNELFSVVYIQHSDN